MSGTGTIYAQVSEWLHANGRWQWVEAGGADRLALVATWREVAGEYGDGSSPACGALLALVREAWGPGARVLLDVDDTGASVSVCFGDRVTCDVDGDTLGHALAAALMAAPRGLEISTADPDTCALCYGEGGAYGPCRSCKRTKAGEP